MADSKVTQLPTLTNPSSEDLLYIIDNPNVSPASKKITLKQFFGNVNSNTNISQSLNVVGDTTLADLEADKVVVSEVLVLGPKETPSSSTDTSKASGSLFWDDNYLYIKITGNVVKRIPLATF